ncbi:MAG TPA: PIG-L family deacetylase [Actinomycetota bacterium]
MSRRRLAVIVAHPDDDTFSCAGTVALHADDPDLHFVLIHVTSGERGKIAQGSGATPETLGEVREEEDRRSWVALGREPDRHEWLRYPDHSVADADRDELAERIATILREERPDVVSTFGPDGITGHPDHVVAGEAASTAFHQVRGEGGPGLSRLLHQAIPQSMLDGWNEQLIAAGKEPMDPTEAYQPRGVPDDQVGVRVDCTGVVMRKLAAVREHVTQMTDIDGPIGDEAGMVQALAFEIHVIAWPPSEPGAEVLTDVFEGLDNI